MDQGAAKATLQFGSYEILETVGQGGMGVVYRAYDTGLKRVVALKILRDDLRDQAHLVARFQREAEAYASLNHPNIVHIYSVGRVGRIPYIAMECIDGVPLSRLLKTERRVGWRRALEMAQEIANALACAHAAQIIHRDIKPGNIIIGHDGHAYVTDFGIAKVLNAETQLTVDGARLGTPQYMSPERCQNRETTAASDIYSLGIMLFQMIGGQLPFQSDSATTLIQQIMMDPPPRVSSLCPGVPESVDRLVAYMIEKKPENRPQSAALLCEVLARVQEGKPLTARDGATVEAIRSYQEALSTPTPGAENALRGHKQATKPRRFPATGAPRRLGVKRHQWTVLVVLSAVLVALVSAAISARLAGPAGALYPLPRDAQAWQLSGAVARFVEEGPGVLVAELQLPGYEVEEVRWLDAGRQVAVVLRGRHGTARADHVAVVVVDAAAHAAELAAPPFDAAGRDLSLLSDERGTLYAAWGDQVGALYEWQGLVAEAVVLGQERTVLRGEFETIAVAPDNQGRRQLWQTGPQPHQRRQLTFLSSGTGDLCQPSGNGSRVVSTVDRSGPPALVFVSLEP
jgi:tRNA A-37 threonylcarbamoyl transferase component Bud32